MTAVKNTIGLIMLLISVQGYSQITQTIRGTISDRDSKYPLIGVNVVLKNSDPLKGAVTDMDGNFVLTEVPTGRQTLSISMIGYKEVLAENLLVISGKELVLNLELEENVIMADAIVIRAGKEKIEVNNELATVSARSFNPEEASRYAGSRNDPARMAANFAGVSGVNDARNDIIIRGNSPSGLLWRLEGVDVPNPNHFASFGSTGGPVSMINYNLLQKSDFMTSAFPSNYGNTVSGVFDIQLRNGNNAKSEYLGQVGFNGLELGAEGPFSKNSKASYLVNCRYSTLGLFDALGVNFGTGTAVPKYQDLTFKINLPTSKAGRFTLFGLGGISEINLLGSDTDFTDAEADLYGNENEDIYVESQTAIVGLTHTYYFNPNTYSHVTLAYTHQKNGTEVDSLVWSEGEFPELVQAIRYNSINYSPNRLMVNASFNKKFDTKNLLTAGVVFSILQNNFADSTLIADGTWWTIKRGEGSDLLGQSYVNWQHRFSDKWTLNSGVHLLHFNLNNSLGIEPRAGLSYQLTPSNIFSVGYGLHHQLQPLPTYYTKRPDGSNSLNQEMDFTRAHHIVLGYDHTFSADFRLKSEVYYQSLDQVPVENFPSTFSMLNTGVDFGTPDEYDLVNTGKGRNYGVELTLEKFYSKQYYFLVTTSVFKSEYQASDLQWRSTAFDSNFIINLLGGKEWNVGKRDNNFGVDVKLTTAGGRPFTPINLEASNEAGEEILDYNRAFQERFDNYFRTDVKIYLRMNRPRVTHEIALDIQNITNRENPYINRYNTRTMDISIENQLGLFPIPQYRILF